MIAFRVALESRRILMLCSGTPKSQRNRLNSFTSVQLPAAEAFESAYRSIPISKANIGGVLLGTGTGGKLEENRRGIRGDGGCGIEMGIEILKY